MCGVFGAVSMNGNALSVPLLRRMALDAQSRGRHAHGLAWVTTGGALRHDKAPGAFGDNLDLVDVAARSQAVIGHCRFTTMGDPKVNRNNHPHYVEDGLFVHNGKVENYGHLVSSRGLEPETGCDSEVIGLMVEQYRGGLLQRIERSVNAVDGSMALLGLWSRPFRMAVVRRGRPLYGCAWDGVWYFCSLPWALPRAKRIRRDSVRIIRRSEGGVTQTIRELTRARKEEADPRRRGVSREYRDAESTRQARGVVQRCWWAD